MITPIADHDVSVTFDDVGLRIDGAEVGMFAGVAHVDHHGSVVGLELDTYVTDPVNPLLTKKAARYFRVPHFNAPMSLRFDDVLATHLAHAVTLSHQHQIQDALNDWSVSVAEREWHPEPAE